MTFFFPFLQVSDIITQTLGPNLELDLNFSCNHSNFSEKDPMERIFKENSIRESQTLKGKNENWNHNQESSRSSTGDWRENILNDVMDSFQSQGSSNNVPRGYSKNILQGFSKNVPQGSILQDKNEEHSILSLSYEYDYPDRYENHYRNILKTQFQLEEKSEIENNYEIFQEKVRSPRYSSDENFSNFQSEYDLQSRSESEPGTDIDLHSTIELENLLLAMDDVTGNNSDYFNLIDFSAAVKTILKTFNGNFDFFFQKSIFNFIQKFCSILIFRYF